MELYEEIACYAEGTKNMKFTGKEQKERYAEQESYKVLKKIQKILADEELNDAECFFKIEEMVKSLGEIGVSAGGRHDF